ncbi:MULTISPECIES: M23 family metallopeptidase [unclassified Aureimonas]|uniref:M23 family metallopeptidase n=1 Tax=unclassified Aureimonas TaxID=2615206 RepID=UPI0007004F3E|nr:MULTISPECIES: M23 family metallopeptidase [unclassified Aureimonas]KQT60410.1 hypothetical protein ASG62_07085 [Aureimonas sp. Leaf427]KQT79288.1 hypothetical protein ASG54_09685 [Aureimonas sp. Leaf460]
MSSGQHHGAFGRPALPHTVVIARGETIRHFTVRPAMLALTTALVSAAMLGAFGSAAYVLLHEDLQTAGVARQARLAQAYEDRIATLRAQLDRSVSRQLLDREKVETKVAVLLDQQVELEARYDKLAPLLDRARSSGLIEAGAEVPVPVANPRSLDSVGAEGQPLAYSATGASQAFDRFKLVDHLAGDGLSAPIAGSKPQISPDLIRSIGEAVETHEARQIEKLDALAEGARAKAAGITDALRSEGIRLPLPEAEQTGGQGGPFEPVPEGYRFEASLGDLDTALTRLDAVQTGIRHLPLERPVATTAISSTFGVRSDPFLGQAAMHTGLDFVAESGTRVAATAPGTVVSAGLTGGYGQMVEVDHGDGYATRYAHLSRILIGVGDKVAAGDIVGEVGSTGRSTGPHLHYEVRHSGIAVDPAGYLRAGKKIDRLG